LRRRPRRHAQGSDERVRSAAVSLIRSRTADSRVRTMSVTKTRTADRILTDDVHESPVARELLRFRRILFWVIVGIVVLLRSCVAWHFCSGGPVRYSSAEDHFKYGSIGSEVGGSVLRPVGGILPPYWIFKVLPAICPDKLPGGYASLGLLFESGHEM